MLAQGQSVARAMPDGWTSGGGYAGPSHGPAFSRG
jgi:hypothetical protein